VDAGSSSDQGPSATQRGSTHLPNVGDLVIRHDCQL
jgi:hypothetical protein